MMKEIIFPGVGLNLNVSSVAINIGNINIYWYAIIIVSAFIIGVLFCKKDDGKYNIKFDNILELMVILIPISIIGARIFYVVFKLDYYIQYPENILNIRDGGLAIYGGIIGAIITIIIYCKKKKISVLDITDYLVPYLALGQAIGRWGNFFNVEAHGSETTSIFRMGIIENGKYIEVHPTFLYESICNLIIFLILYLLRNKRKYKGQITYLYLALYGIVRAVIEGLRTDSLMLGSFRISQVLSIVLFIIFTIIVIFKELKYKKEKNKNRNENEI